MRGREFLLLGNGDPAGSAMVKVAKKHLAWGGFQCVSMSAHAAWVRAKGIWPGEEQIVGQEEASSNSSFCFQHCFEKVLSFTKFFLRAEHQPNAGPSPMSVASVMEWEPCGVASVFMTPGHPCLCQPAALAGSKETLQLDGDTAFVRIATLLSCKHHAANPTSVCPHMHFLPVLGTDADVQGEFFSRPHVSYVYYCSGTSYCPWLYFFVKHSSDSNHFKFCKPADHYCQSLYE